MPHIDNINDYYDEEEQARRESKRLIERVRTLEGEVRFLDEENAELHQTVIDQAAKLDELEARLQRLEEDSDDEPDEPADECNCWSNDGPECISDHFGGQCYYDYVEQSDGALAGDA